MADTSSPSCHITLSRHTIMWRMLSALHGVYEVSSSGGGYCAPGPADRQSEAARPLDPIDVAGSADLRVLSTMATTLKFSAAIDALNWLRDATSILDTTRPFPLRGRGRDTADKFLNNITDLERWGIVTEVKNPQNWKGYLSTYFQVPKTDVPPVDRTIFNGRQLSTHFIAPPVVNLMDAPDVIRYVHSFSGRKTFCHVLDLRHWFHQIRMSGSTRDLFNIRCGQRVFRWEVLPMGWSFSPRICQCLAWTAILASSNPQSNTDGMQQARVDIENGKDPPRYVVLRNNAGVECGFISHL